MQKKNKPYLKSMQSDISVYKENDLTIKVNKDANEILIKTEDVLSPDDIINLVKKYSE